MEAETKIIETLERLQQFFERHRVSGWTQRTKKTIQQIQAGQGNKAVLNNFVGAGMGSLIDLYICTDNGHVLIASEAEINKELETLTNEILTIKHALR
jgi:hypothetical protein